MGLKPRPELSPKLWEEKDCEDCWPGETAGKLVKGKESEANPLDWAGPCCAKLVNWVEMMGRRVARLTFIRGEDLMVTGTITLCHSHTLTGHKLR